jgi:uncharacterized protein (TIGR00730 family)
MRVCVFCGARNGRQDLYQESARKLGWELGSRGIDLVYGGAKIGLMGSVADAALEAGSEVTGVMPRYLLEWEIAHEGLAQMHIVEGLRERKEFMASLADAFIALPGGVSTVEEFFEVWTWTQQGLHDKPCGLLNLANYYDGLLAFLDHAVDEGFVGHRSRGTLIVDTEVRALVDALVASAKAS